MRTLSLAAALSLAAVTASAATVAGVKVDDTSSVGGQNLVLNGAALRKKFYHVQVRKDETINRRIESMFASLQPSGALQERSMNVGHFLNRYGANFIDWVYQATDLDDTGHRLIYL